ncbi:MAG: adenylate/guanylate cyclase domain-containing protein [Bacteroidota bacterium]
MLKSLSPKARRNIARIIPFGVIWYVSSLVFLIVEYAAAGGLNKLPSTAIQIDFEIFFFMSLAVSAVGLIIGIIELVYLNNVFVKKSFTKKILYKTFLYTLLLFVITAGTFPIAASMELNTSLLDKRVWHKLSEFLTSITHLSTAVQLAIALGVSLFYSEISENIGHRVLINFFTGKYHTPKEENRIFMFADMKSSTSIAEKIGHVKYFELLKEYYFDLSDAIVKYSGEVYQYVGDEIVVSWEFKAGIRDNNCIKCFFAMKKDLKKRTDWYMKSFGVLPEFKAGYHFGKVTTGEIGALKKEIIFTGDVLNATARIQGLCNHYQVDLLVSNDLKKNLELATEFKVNLLGENELRGKTEKIKLCTVTQNENS